MATPRFSIGLIAVPERVDMLKNLMRRLREVAPGVHLDVYIDHTYEGLWPMMVRALSTTHGLPYRMLMQEDGWPCLDFGATVERIVDNLERLEHSDYLVGMYSNHAAVHSRYPGQSFVYYGETWGVANLYTVGMLPHLLAFMNQYRWPESNDFIPRHVYGFVHRDGRKGIGGDGWCSYYFPAFGIPMFMTTVGLVQHLGGMRSTLGHKFAPESGKNVCRYYIGDDVSGLTVDWSRLPSRRELRPTFGVTA